MIRKLFVLLNLMIFCSLFEAYAQTDSSLIFVEEKTKLFRNEASGGGLLHANGWGLNFRRGKNLTGYIKRIYEAEFATMKHPKEIKTNSYYDNNKSYVFGKENSLYVLRTGAGIQQVIYSKADKSGVEIRFNYTGGISWGITKPVYLDILDSTNVAPIRQQVVSQKYDPEKHNADVILGNADFGYGLKEMKLYPGGYGRFGISFEHGSSEEDIRILEAGVSADAYLRSLPLMAFVPQKQIFFSFYITYMWGKKW